jgi:hypothetical protein
MKRCLYHPDDDTSSGELMWRPTPTASQHHNLNKQVDQMLPHYGILKTEAQLIKPGSKYP